MGAAVDRIRGLTTAGGKSVMTGGGIAGGLNHAIKQRTWSGMSALIPL
jgi:hypothetical protein